MAEVDGFAVPTSSVGLKVIANEFVLERFVETVGVLGGVPGTEGVALVAFAGVAAPFAAGLSMSE